LTNISKFSLFLEEDQYILHKANTDESTVFDYELSYSEFLEACKMKETTNLLYDIKSVVKNNILNDENEYRVMLKHVRRTKSMTVSQDDSSE